MHAREQPALVAFDDIRPPGVASVAVDIDTELSVAVRKLSEFVNPTFRTAGDRTLLVDRPSFGLIGFEELPACRADNWCFTVATGRVVSEIPAGIGVGVDGDGGGVGDIPTTVFECLTPTDAVWLVG